MVTWQPPFSQRSAGVGVTPKFFQFCQRYVHHDAVNARQRPCCAFAKLMFAGVILLGDLDSAWEGGGAIRPLLFTVKFDIVSVS